MGVHRYNHNLETARSHFPNVVTTHTWEERWETLRMVRDAGMEVCCGGILGMGETLEQRAEFAANLAALEPDEVPLNFLNPRPGTPFGDLEVLPAADALRAVAAFRLALPRTILRFAGGREITLGDLGAKQGILGGINAVIVGNYLTTLGRPAEARSRPARRAADADQGAQLDALTPRPIKWTSATTPTRAGGSSPATTTPPRPPRRWAWSRRASASSAGAGWSSR